MKPWFLIALAAVGCVSRSGDDAGAAAARAALSDGAHLFDDTMTPAAVTSGSFELGVKLTSDVAGALRKLRFYKPANSTGTHVGHLWDASGHLLVTAPFTNETASGWQETAVSVPIAAGQTYIASYSVAGSFGYDLGYFDQPRDRAPLHAPVGAGVYASPGSFPTHEYQNANYWVDVQLDAGACASWCTTCGVDDGCGNLCCAAPRYSIWAPSDGPSASEFISNGTTYELGTRFTPSVDGVARALRYYKAPNYAGPLTGRLWDSDGHLLGTASFIQWSDRWRPAGWYESPLSTPVALTAQKTYVVSYGRAYGFAYTPNAFSVNGRDALPLFVPQNGGVYGNPGTFPTQTYQGTNYWSDVVFAPNAPSRHIFAPSATPALPQYPPNGYDFELGVRFSAEIAGTVTKLRFYKGPGNDGPHVGHLWAESGALLATATFTGETSSGWQEVVLPQPVAIVPGTTYVASYNTSSGFAWTSQFFAASYAYHPFVVPATGGVFAVGTAFPTNSYDNGNYWVDVTFDAAVPSARPLGVNLPFLLAYYFNPPPLAADEARRQLDLAARRGFTHARVEGSQYWPAQMTGSDGWLTNPRAYFARFDTLVRDARSRGVRLIPSLLWNHYLFPDLAHEPRGMLFVPGSASRQLAERYVADVVRRYRDDDTILFWEIGNEWNLGADIDATCDACADPTRDCGSTAPVYGTPCFRSAADNFSSCNACRGVSSTQQDLGEFSAAIARLIHSIDPSRKVSSGDALMRPSAWHLARQSLWPAWTGWPGVSDTPAQYAETLLQLHPAGVDIISTHPYRGRDVALFGDSDLAGAALIARTQQIARQAGKQLYAGEYGELNGGTYACASQTCDCGGDGTKQATHRIIDSLVANDVAYSALWAFESTLDNACPQVPGCYSVVDGDPLTDYLAARQRAYGTCVGLADGQTCPGGACAAQVCVAPLTASPGTPTTVKQWIFNDQAALVGWSSFTSCSNCTPGTFTFDTGQKIAFAATNDLTCTDSCAFPGLFVSSPEFLVQPGGHLTLRFSGRTTRANVSIWLFVKDAAGNTVYGQAAAVESGSGFTANGTLFPLSTIGPDPATCGGLGPLPLNATRAFVQLKVLEPRTRLDIESITVEQQR